MGGQWQTTNISFRVAVLHFELLTISVNPANRRFPMGISTLALLCLMLKMPEAPGNMPLFCLPQSTPSDEKSGCSRQNAVVCLPPKKSAVLRGRSTHVDQQLSNRRGDPPFLLRDSLSLEKLTNPFATEANFQHNKHITFLHDCRHILHSTPWT